MEASVVFKVCYGDTLRRFNVHVNDKKQMDLDMAALRAKILNLFSFPPDTDLNLTYVDEDGDLVSLVNDDDLRDVMRQNLKFVRINVQLSDGKFGKSYAKSSGSSTPVRSPRVQNPLPKVNTGVAEVLKTVPEPLREVLSKLSLDLASKATSSSPLLAELVDCFSKMGQSYLYPGPQSEVRTDSGAQSGDAATPAVSTDPTIPNASESSSMQEVPPNSHSTFKTSQEAGVVNVTRVVRAPATDVPPAVDLNMDPPSESNPSECKTVNFPQATSDVPAGGCGKETKKQNARYPSGKSVIFGAFPRSVDPMRPVDSACPFSGMPMVNPILNPRFGPFKRSASRNDAMVGMFHKGVRCDGCGALPITGPRYKSKVQDDFDLCSVCFSEMGDEADYIKMDRPVPYRHHRFLSGLHHDSHRWIGPPSRVARTSGMKPACAMKPARFNKLDSRFILDVNVLDGTLVIPSTPFTKIWRMRNSGGVAWPQGTRIMWIGGDRFSHADTVDLEIPVDGVPVDGELDIAVDFTSPELPGRYISYWRMASPSGAKFGQRVWVLIQVDASLEGSLFGSVQDLNLNLPPDCGGAICREIIDCNATLPDRADVNAESVVDGGSLDPLSSAFVLQPVNPAIEEQPKKDQDLNFPVDDALLVDHGVSMPAPQVPSSVTYPGITGLGGLGPFQGPSHVPYPVIDFSEAAPTGPSHTPTVNVPTSSEGISVNDVEKSLLKELEDMGFKQVDLNKEILRTNEYNLEQSVDALCGVAEWDYLEELEGMGFHDAEKNRKLLEKNNGSIKRVVMDLLTGEKS